MFKQIISYVLVAIVAGSIGYLVCQNTKVRHQQILLNAYDDYEEATECLLDDLELEYNWTHTINNPDYYSTSYYLDSLIREENKAYIASHM